MKKTIILCIVASFLGCQTILINLISSKSVDKHVRVLENKTKESTIVFLPTVHVGKPGYYESFKPIVDSLRKDGFQVFVESIAYKKELDSISKEQYDIKFRKFTGHHTTLSKHNNSLPKEYRLKNYIFQDYNLMGINKQYGDSVLDLSKKQLIDIYEKEFGEVKLNKCDSITPLGEKYNCESEYKNHVYQLTNIYRDQYIRNYLLNTNHKKIVLIYGRSHWIIVYPRFTIKHGYSLVKGKP